MAALLSILFMYTVLRIFTFNVLMESTLWFSLYECVDYCPLNNVVLSECEIQWNLSKTATCGPVITGLYREVVALQR